MTTTLHHEIEIAARPAAVWKALADLTAVEHYNPGVTQAAWADAKRSGVGSGRVCQVLPKGETRETVTVWEPEKALGLEMTETPWPPIRRMEWVTRLEAAGGSSTRITQDLHYEVGAGPLGWLINTLILRRKLWGSLDDVLHNLGDYVTEAS